MLALLFYRQVLAARGVIIVRQVLEGVVKLGGLRLSVMEQIEKYMKT